MEFKPSNWNHIQQLSTTTLADCPWPPSDSHCSPCTIDRPKSYEIIMNIWGEYAGNPNRKRFYAQTACTDVTPIKRFVCKVGRLRTATVPDGKGLFIGLVTEDVLNDPAKLYDPSKWQWAGYLSSLSGGTPVIQYYLCADINLTWTTTQPVYLLMVTNGSYDNVGWIMGSYSDTSFPNIQPLWEYNLNEPTKPDGWSEMDNRWKGAYISYGAPSGALVEGLCEIKNPSFPGSAQEGTPYQFIFDVQQHTAFPCGCPETIVWQLFNRDDNTPLHDPVQYLLACGYSGITGFTGTINFSGSGTFHGQLKVGHKTNGQWMIDDTHNFEVVIGNGYPCSHWTNQTDCISHGCYWWSNGTCHDTQETTTDTLEKAITCKTFNGCDHKTPGSCSCGDEGSKVTTFELDEEIIAYALISSSDLYGKTIKIEWYHEGINRWTYSWSPITQHWTYACVWAYWAIGQSYGAGTGHIKIYLDDVYLGKTNDYTIETTPPPPPDETIGTIIDGEYYTGPFLADGSPYVIAKVTIKNTGNKTGTIYGQPFLHPGTPNEQARSKTGKLNIAPGETWQYTPVVSFQTTIPPGTLPVGIKIWGDTEQEPSW